MKKNLLKGTVLGLGAAALFSSSQVQAAPTFYFGDGKKLTIFQMVQVWDVYTTETGKTDTDSRNDLYIRRGRIGVKGTIRKDMSFKVWFAYDNLGKDKNTGATGGTSQFGADNREFYIWDAIWTWKANPEWANISVGYFRPQVGKESITTAFKVISFQKSYPNFQPRRHIVGRGPGRETGINIGGLALNKKLNYNIGIFDAYNSLKNWSPMYAVRVAWTFGDPEMKKYKMGYTQTYYGKRNGTTIGLNYTYQGETDYFTSNTLLGVDILANYGAVDFNAEYDVLKRKGFTDADEDYTNKVWSVKIGYNKKLQNGQIFRPAFMYSSHNADSIFSSLAGTIKGGVHGSLKKDYRMYEISLNWLINKDKLKLNIAFNHEKVAGVKNEYVGAGLQLIY